MKSVIDAIVGILMIVAVGASLPYLYRTVATFTLLKVYDQLKHQDHLEDFTRKLIEGGGIRPRHGSHNSPGLPKSGKPKNEEHSGF